MQGNPKQTDGRRTERTDRSYRKRSILAAACRKHDENVPAIADEFGVSATTIRRWLLRFDLVDPDDRDRPTNEQDTDGFPWHDPEQLQRAYDACDGKVRAVADEFGIHESTASEALARYDIHDPEEYGATKLEKLNPEDVGLSPLGSASVDGPGGREVVADGGRPNSNGGDA